MIKVINNKPTNQQANMPVIEKKKKLIWTIAIKQRYPQPRFSANWSMKARSLACRILLYAAERKIAANTDTKGKQRFLNAVYFLDLSCVRIQTWFIQSRLPAVFLPEYCFLTAQENRNKIGLYARKNSKNEKTGDWLWSPQTVPSTLHVVWMNCDSFFNFKKQS